MVTKKELYDNPKVVARILEEVEKQREYKFQDLEFLDDKLTLDNQLFGFTWKESIEWFYVWEQIYFESNFVPFYEFCKKQEKDKEKEKTQAVRPFTEQPKVYTIKEVIEQKLVVNTKTLDEYKRLLESFKKEGFYGHFYFKDIKDFYINIKCSSSFCFYVSDFAYYGFIEDYRKEEGLIIIDSTQVVTNELNETNKVVNEAMNSISHEITPPKCTRDGSVSKIKENVNHPNHYGGKDNPHEAIKVIEAWDLGFNLGNTIKYISRAGKKDETKTLQDLEKAKWYLERQINNLKNK